jgi:ribonuclease-3
MENFNESIVNYDFSKPHMSRCDIEKIIGMRPINVEYYLQAFVHKSIQKSTKYSNQAMNYTKQSYERYEYLGDSVLNMVIANYLFKKYPDKNEGFLTRLRTKLVNGKTLAKLSSNLELGQHLLLSNHVEKIDGRSNNRILEDIFEALICAIFLDLGYNKSEKFIVDTIEKTIDFDKLLVDNNFKDILLRFCQSKMNTTPVYRTIEVSGPPHKRVFKVCCYIERIPYKYGTAPCKKDAEQLAAQLTLDQFGVSFGNI